MKILCHHRIRSKDGQAVHLEELMNAFRELGHEVLLVGPQSYEQAEFGHDPKLLTAIKNGVPKVVYELLEIGYNLLAYIRLKKAWRKFQPDFIYERHNLYLLAGTLLKKRHHVPYLLEINAPLARERLENGGLGLPGFALALEHKVWRSADFALPVTQVLANEIVAGGASANRVEVIPNGINSRLFSEHGSSVEESKTHLGLQGKIVLGFTGFVREWHGLDAVIDLLPKPEFSTTHLVVVGDGPAVPALKAQSERLNLSTRVLFTGLVDRGQVSNYVNAFDIALQPKCVEYASPLKLFEYMALGKAILAPDQPNIREVLENNVSALLFDANEKRNMVQCLTRLVADKNLRAHLGENAKTTIAARNFTWIGNAQRVIALGLRAKQNATKLDAAA